MFISYTFAKINDKKQMNIEKEYPYFTPILESIDQNVNSVNHNNLIDDADNDILIQKWENMPIGTVFQDQKHHRFGVVIEHKWGLVDIAYLYPRKLTYKTAWRKCKSDPLSFLPQDFRNIPEGYHWELYIMSQTEYDAYIQPHIDKLLTSGPFWTSSNSYWGDDDTKWLSNGISAYNSDYNKVIYLLTLNEN